MNRAEILAWLLVAASSRKRSSVADPGWGKLELYRRNLMQLSARSYEYINQSTVTSLFQLISSIESLYAIFDRITLQSGNFRFHVEG